MVPVPAYIFYFFHYCDVLFHNNDSKSVVKHFHRIQVLQGLVLEKYALFLHLMIFQEDLILLFLPILLFPYSVVMLRFSPIVTFLFRFFPLLVRGECLLPIPWFPSCFFCGLPMMLTSDFLVF